ncbi:MAG TPA: VOC family protein [Terriglobia bacterium]|nr:VOC family protein [Terriglobia bacterium]
MPNIDKHAVGSFCWIELGTTDQNAAKNFYGSLFGWHASDMPMGPDSAYTFFKLEGRDAAAGYTLMPEQRAAGVPPHWLPYILVESADESAQRAADSGGKVLKEPFDVMEAGRMAVLQDPAGAVFAVWQAKADSGSGIGIGGVDGTLCWADLSVPNRESVERFYSDLFGWVVGKEDEAPEHNYWHIKNGEEFIGGIPPATSRNPNSPPHWLAYFLVSDCDGSATKARELGAAVYLPPMTMENVGRMAVVADPQGAVFALFQPLPHQVY